MAAASKKNSLLEQRRKEVEAKLAQIRKDLETIAKDGRKVPASSLPRMSPPGALSVSRPGVEAPIDNTDGDVTTAPSMMPSAMPPMAPGGIPVHDERFASYFITGSVHGIKPLRREQRIIRNRAILIGIVILLMLIWVVGLLMDL